MALKYFEVRSTDPSVGSDDVCVMPSEVGIGITTPNCVLNVHGNDATDGDLSYQVHVANSVDGYTTPPKSGIMFSSKYNSTDLAGMGGIGVGKENASSGNYAAFLSLCTRHAGGNVTERLRISSDGNVGIGTTAPSDRLTRLSAKRPETS